MAFSADARPRNAPTAPSIHPQNRDLEGARGRKNIRSFLSAKRERELH
jgi:hypothetical protein